MDLIHFNVLLSYVYTGPWQSTMSASSKSLSIFGAVAGNGARIGIVVAAIVASLMVLLFVASEGNMGEKVASALEEMSLVIALMVIHLCASRIFGKSSKATSSPKKAAAWDEPEHVSDSRGRADMREGEQTELNEEEEFQQREIGTITTKIRAAVRAGDMAGAEDLMKKMQDTCGRPGALRRACWAVSFGELVSGFVRCDDAQSAGRWLGLFADASPTIRPSTACCNSVIAAFAKHGNVEQAEAIMARMATVGVKIDEETYTGVINACVAVGETQRAARRLRDMRAAGLRPGLGLHRLVLQACADGGESGRSSL